MSSSSGRNCTVTRREPVCVMCVSRRQTKSATRSARKVQLARKIAEYPDHVRDAGEHHAAISHRVGKDQRVEEKATAQPPLGTTRISGANPAVDGQPVARRDRGSERWRYQLPRSNSAVSTLTIQNFLVRARRHLAH
jgi:hypothetical protein